VTQAQPAQHDAADPIEQALAAHRAGRYEDALALLRAGLATARATPGAEGDGAVARALRGLGFVYDDLGDYPTALEYHLQALALDEARGDDAARAVTLRTIGIVYSKAGDPVQGLDFYRRSLDLAQRCGDDESSAKTLNNIGINCKNLGRLDEARDALERALMLFEAAGHTQGQAGALANLGLVLEKLQLHAAAEHCQRRALELGRRTNYLLAQINALRNLGRLLDEFGRSDEALACLNDSLALAEASSSAPERAECHRALSALHKRAGRAADALAHFEAYHRFEREVFNDASDRKLKQLQVRYRVAELERLSLEDALTGLYNRRYLDARLDEELARAHSLGRPLALALIDVDDFKLINDRWSHQAGDAVLKTLGRLLRAHARAADIVARYGGEEFAIVFPGTDVTTALAACERLRAEVAAHDWPALRSGLAVTLSIGLAGRDGNIAALLMAAADAALYRAKAGGKNRVCA
jgi:diguanylate cyclase (GGDEF)-like protein